MAIVKFDNVTKTYTTGEHEQKALDHVSFTLDEGKFVVILGPSGAGKSTLLNLLGGLDSPSAGTITVNGKDISKLIDNELATLKVLGFKNKNIGKLLISQNIWLTVIGVIIGLPSGVGVLEWLLAALAGEYELKLMLGPMTYCVSVLLTFGVSLLVGMMVARKNRRIDMVEALKIAE